MRSMGGKMGICTDCTSLRWATAAPCRTCGRSGGLNRLPLPALIRENVRVWISEHTLPEIALVPALIPLLVPLPLISLAMFIGSSRGRDLKRHAIEWRLVLIAAVFNLILSFWVLSALSDMFLTNLLYWWSEVPRFIHAIPAEQSNEALI